MNVQSVFDHYKISTRSAVQCCSEVGQLIRDSAVPEHTATTFIHQLLNRQVRFNDAVYAGIFTKALCQELISVNCEVDDPDCFIEVATDYAVKFCNDPKWSFLWAKDDEVTTKVETKVQVLEEVDIQVAVKADGTKKKGWKQILANELYRQTVVDTTTPITNQQFISLIMDKLEMTKAGATTYAYNAKKKYENEQKS